MKEALICFLLALVIGSILNGTKAMDTFGASGNNGPSAASKNIPVVTEGTFQTEVLESTTPVLVDFYTDSCPHCRNMVPAVEHLANQLKGSLKVVRMDAMENPTTAQTYEVKGVPMFVVFKNGLKVDSTSGEQDENELLGMVKKYVESNPNNAAPGAAPKAAPTAAPTGAKGPVAQANE